MKTLLATSAVLLLSAGTALAQDEDSTTGDGEATEDSGGGGGGETATAPDDGGGGGGADPKMGIGTELNTAGDLPAVHLLYSLGGNYIDGILAFGIKNTAPDVGDSDTAFTIGIGVGYRMYKAMDGRIHPYLEPYLHFGIFNDSLDTTTNTTSFGAGAMLGVDFKVFDQFTLGAAVGGGLQYEMDSDPEKANILSIGLYTTSINATFWWG